MSFSYAVNISQFFLSEQKVNMNKFFLQFGILAPIQNHLLAWVHKISFRFLDDDMTLMGTIMKVYDTS